MSAAELITLMLPYSATALILLLIWIQVAAAKAPHVCGSEKDKTLLEFSDRKALNMEYLAAVSYTHLDVYKRQLKHTAYVSSAAKTLLMISLLFSTLVCTGHPAIGLSLIHI